MHKRTIDQPTTINNEMPWHKRVIIAGVAASVALGLVGCGPSDEKAAAKPAPVKTSTTITGSAQETSGPVKPTMESTSKESVSSTEARPIPPLREWNIKPNTLKDLQGFDGDTKSQWAILKHLVEDNNPGASYFGKYGAVSNGDVVQNNSVSPNLLAERTFLELSTMSDLAIDPSQKDGLEIASIWANLAFINPDRAQQAIEDFSKTRANLSGDESHKYLDSQKQSPLLTYNKIIHASDRIYNFRVGGEEYTGAIFLVQESIPETQRVEEDNFAVLTVVFTKNTDDNPKATRILRLNHPGGKESEVNFEPGVSTVLGSIPKYTQAISK